MSSTTKGIGMQAYRAPSLFQPHRARDVLADAHAGRIPPLMGYSMLFSSVQLARIVAQLGYDWVWVDWEHSPMDVETMTTVSLPYPPFHKLSPIQLLTDTYYQNLDSS